MKIQIILYTLASKQSRLELPSFLVCWICNPLQWGWEAGATSFTSDGQQEFEHSLKAANEKPGLKWPKTTQLGGYISVDIHSVLCQVHDLRSHGLQEYLSQILQMEETKYLSQMSKVFICTALLHPWNSKARFKVWNLIQQRHFQTYFWSSWAEGHSLIT